MNVLSLFDGMSCGQIALDRLGVKIDNYFASEIDKHAIKVTQKNYPNTIQLGDVCGIQYEDGALFHHQNDNPLKNGGSFITEIDLLIGGSPCQGFSFAGKQLNFDDPRSKLFFEFVRLLKEIKPRYFLLENVKMKKEFQNVISGYLGVEPIEINSNLVSAQNRKRLYWCNFGIEDRVDIFTYKVFVPQPDDKGIMLKDIVHEYNDEVFNDGYLVDYDKILSGSKIQPSITDGVTTINPVFESGKQTYQQNRVYETGGKFPAISAELSGRFNIINLSKYIVPFDVTLEILDKKIQRGKVGYFRKDSQANRVYYIHNKAVTLTGDSGGGAAKMGQYLFGVITPDRIEKRQNGQRFNDGKKFYTLTAQDKHGVLVEGYIRKLTPIECERLQTVKDNEISCIFALCLEKAKNYVNVVSQNPKLLKLVLDAEQSELNEFVKSALLNMSVNHRLIKHTVHQNADMQIHSETKQCTNHSQQESNINVNNAELSAMCNSQKEWVDFAQPNVFINIIEGRIMHFGLEELHQKDSHFTNLLNGSKLLKLYGNEIMELAKGAIAETIKAKGTNFTYTTLYRSNTKSLEQMLIIYYLFAKNAIIGYTQNTIQTNNLLLNFNLKDGYTSIVSDTQRYKMLGNGWTVDVIKHILSFADFS